MSWSARRRCPASRRGAGRMPAPHDALPGRHLTRRGFIQGFVALGGGLALSVACGQQAPAPAKPAETRPAEAPKPAESTPTEAVKPAAPAATTAPTAAKPAESKPAEAAKPAETAKPAASGDAPKKGGTLRVGLYVEAVTMDPNISGSTAASEIYTNVYEPLVGLDNKLQIQPGLAESW